MENIKSLYSREELPWQKKQKPLIFLVSYYKVARFVQILKENYQKEILLEIQSRMVYKDKNIVRILLAKVMELY
jgi:hypothetical protein